MTTATWNTNEPQASTGGSELLPTDTYLMKISEASIEDDKFAEPDRDGKQPQNIVLIWEIARLTPEQADAGIVVGERVWHRIRAHFGTKKDGTPSRFLAFIQSLVEQKLLPAGEFTVNDLLGIQQRVVVEQYTKTMGANIGQLGNRVSSVSPLTVPRRTKQPIVQPQAVAEQTDEVDLPF